MRGKRRLHRIQIRRSRNGREPGAVIVCDPAGQLAQIYDHCAVCRRITDMGVPAAASSYLEAVCRGERHGLLDVASRDHRDDRRRCRVIETRVEEVLRLGVVAVGGQDDAAPDRAGKGTPVPISRSRHRGGGYRGQRWPGPA